MNCDPFIYIGHLSVHIEGLTKLLYQKLADKAKESYEKKKKYVKNNGTAGNGQ